jgi:hypothetical protein
VQAVKVGNILACRLYIQYFAMAVHADFVLALEVWNCAGLLLWNSLRRPINRLLGFLCQASGRGKRQCRKFQY